MKSPNIFEALFTYRPREGNTPKENFLTEGFAYVLKTIEPARIAWVKEILGKDTPIVDDPIIETQKYYNSPDNAMFIFVDMVITFSTPNREKISIFSEHKWDSPTNRQQLKKYIEIAKSIGDGSIVTFIGSSWVQRGEAAHCPDIKAFLWEDVYTCLRGIPNPHNIVIDFTDFLRYHGLGSLEPISIAKMVSYLNGSNLPEICKGYAEKLSTLNWDVIPQRYRDEPQVTDRWGRIGIEFHKIGDWNPCITVGFLYNGSDHRVELIDSHRGIDLLLRIEAGANEFPDLGEVEKVITRKAVELRTFQEQCESAFDLKKRGETKNRNTILLVRECLADTIKNSKTEEEQIKAIHGRLLNWCKVLFEDGTLDKALKQTFREKKN